MRVCACMCLCVPWDRTVVSVKSADCPHEAFHVLKSWVQPSSLSTSGKRSEPGIHLSLTTRGKGQAHFQIRTLIDKTMYNHILLIYHTTLIKVILRRGLHLKVCLFLPDTGQKTEGTENPPRPPAGLSQSGNLLVYTLHVIYRCNIRQAKHTVRSVPNISHIFVLKK